MPTPPKSPVGWPKGKPRKPEGTTRGSDRQAAVRARKVERERQAFAALEGVAQARTLREARELVAAALGFLRGAKK